LCVRKTLHSKTLWSPSRKGCFRRSPVAASAGQTREISDAGERIRAIARSYVESPEKTLIVSPDNASRRDLNVAVREELKSKGALDPEDHQFKVLIQRQEMTGAERDGRVDTKSVMSSGMREGAKRRVSMPEHTLRS
jgi:hypothetical protein